MKRLVLPEHTFAADTESLHLSNDMKKPFGKSASALPNKEVGGELCRIIN